MKPTLYLMIGYPGAGKTTVANIIAEQTGAVHLMADAERHKLFPNPTHSPEESIKLYDDLNERTWQLLKHGKSVVFDTNFNFHADRLKLRKLAENAGADTEIIWVTVDVNEAKKRAVHTEYKRNGYSASMTEEHFNEIVSKLEPPAEDEKVIKIDGTNLDREDLIKLLK